MKYVLPAIVAVLALAGLAGPSEARLRLRAMSPEQFAREAAVGNEFEIKSSQLALQKSNNAEIKQFAEKIVQDHTQLADQMKERLKQANLPEVTPQLDEKHQALLTKLEGEKEAAFDRTYVQAQRKAHKQTVQLLEHYARRGDNKTLKELATNTLPMIKEHLKLAEHLPSGRALSARR